MGKIILSMFVILLVIVGCSTTPREHAKTAFRKYSLQCVARGLPENTQPHTDCVVNKYGKVEKERKRGETMMSEIFVEPK